MNLVIWQAIGLIIQVAADIIIVRSATAKAVTVQADIQQATITAESATDPSTDVRYFQCHFKN